VALLLVEDDDADAGIIRADLERRAPQAVAVRRAATLREALDALRDSVPDVVLLDLGLPDAAGLEGLDAIRAEHPDVPVVVITGNADDGMPRAALRRGAQDYLLKGEIDGTAVGRAVGYAMERQRLTTQVAELEAQAEQARELRELERLARDAGTAITARMYDAGRLAEVSPALFARCRDRYADALEVAWRDLRYSGDDAHLDELVAGLAESLGGLGAGPRDVIDLHRSVISGRVDGVGRRQARALREEGRFLVLRVMGLLVDHYRRAALARVDAPAAPRDAG
jgi:DNA-binding NarL/FixJ family response regulator